MSSEQLMHIFDNSSCLTKRQLQAYADNEMISEEAHAAEVHLNTCPFCRMSIEGLQLGGEYAIESVSELNSRFLKDHFSINHPQIHLNSIAAAVPHQPAHHISKHKKRKKTALLTPWTISVAFLLIIGAWYMEFGRVKTQPKIDAPAHQNIPSAIEENESAKVEETGRPETAKDYAVVAANNVKPAKPVKKPTQTIVTTADYVQEQPLTATDNRSGLDNQPVTINTANKSSSEEKKKISKAMAPITQKSSDGIAEKRNATIISTSKPTMKSDDKAARHDAALTAAESYIDAGKDDKAIPLLKQIIEEGGPGKHAAKRLMRQITRDDEVNID